MAEHVLTCYRSRDPTFPLEPVRQGVVEAEKAAAREELIAKREADLAARERAVESWAEQLHRAQTEIPSARGVHTSAADGTSLEDRLKNAQDELETVIAERTNIKLMMWDILQ